MPLEQRRGFDLIDVTLGPEAARQEALRCVQCSTFCDKCVEVCPNRANYSFEVDPVTWELPLLARSGARSEIPGGIVGVLVAGAEEFRLAQNRQIVHVDDFCNECDNCRTFCVHHGRPYADKPRLFLDAAAFGAERDNAFYIEDGLMRRRDEGRESRLTMRDGGAFTYEDDELRVTFTCEWTLVEAEAKKAFEGKRSLRRAAELLVLHRGIGRSLPFLLVR